MIGSSFTSGSSTVPIISYAGSPFEWTVDEAITAASATNQGGASTTWSVESGSLPTGVSLNATTGELTGTPTNEAYAQSVVIRATNATGFDEATIAWGTFALAVWGALGYEDYN